MKRWILLAVAAVLLSSAITLWAWPFPSPDDPRVYGPVRCVNCPVESPMPDNISKAFLDTYGERIGYEGHNATFFPGTGAQFVLCNMERCTTYQVTDDHRWLGIKQEWITPSRRPSDQTGTRIQGGGGGGAGNGGSAGAGPGAWSPAPTQGGSVKVGRLQKF